MNATFRSVADLRTRALPLLVLACAPAAASECASLSIPSGQIVWCDSFEDTDLPPSRDVADNYFNYSDYSGGQRFGRSTNEARDGQYSFRHAWRGGVTDTGPGWMYRTFGRSPLSSQSHSQTDFREIYWRFWVKYPAGTVSFPEKVSRTIVYASPGWAQAMIGHLWLVDHGSRYLRIDPASGTDAAGNLVSTQYNDPNMRWLGGVDSPIPIAVGTWQCHEAHIRLNSAGANNGVFELWLDDALAASRYDLNWVGAYNAYGINAVMIESYWNGGAPQDTERYIDGLVIATGRIGCGTAVVARPMPPTQLVAS
jgi:hypothetical protein